MEGRERLEVGDRPEHGRIDTRGTDERVAAVDDAVGDRVDSFGVDVVKAGDRGRRLVGGDQVELEARRAGVDDEDVAQNGQVQPAMAG